MYMVDEFQIRLFKNRNRMNPKKLTVSDARAYHNLLLRETKAIELLYAPYLKQDEVVFVYYRGNKHEEIISKIKYSTVREAIENTMPWKEGNFAGILIIVDGQVVPFVETAYIDFDRISFIIVKGKND